MDVDPLAIRLIERFEGFPNGGRPYNDPVGFATVGYGHLLHRSRVSPADAQGVWVAGQQRPGVLTRAEASRLLARDLERDYAPAVAALRLPNVHMQSAILSFVFNVGAGGVAPSTHVGAALRRQAWQQAADALLQWDKAGGVVLEGLRIRREAERDLFLRPFDRFEGYPPHERELIESFDRLGGDASPAAVHARAELRRQMWQECDEIGRAAQSDGGWDTHRRKTRHAALERRIGKP